MIKLMEHIDYFYEKIKCIYGANEWYLMYKDKEWLLTCDNAQKIVVFKTKKHNEIIDYLFDLKADMQYLEACLVNNVATEGALRMMQLEKVEKLVGKQTVIDAHEAYKQMGEQIAALIKKPKLELI